MLTDNAVQTTGERLDVPAITCRLCGSTQLRSFLDLGATPACERFLTAEAAEAPEATYPLHVRVCDRCLLAQLPPLITPAETFTEYAYFSSFSTSWVEHARHFVDGAVARLGLGPDSFVVEVASNDGYLLQHVVEKGIRCLGAEPSVNVGEAAREKGVPTLTAFLTPETGAAVRAEHGDADLVCLNNVYAHIPDVVGFTRRLRSLVADDGWVSIEVQHLLTLVERTQFDTIYHEHFQYYTLLTGRRARGGRRAAHGGGPRRVRGGRRLAGPRRPGVVPDRGQACRQAGDRIRCARQGQHPAELLREPAGPARVHSGPQPVRARAVHTRHADPGAAARADRPGPPGLRPDPSLEPARRARRAAVLRPRVGAGLVFPIPELEVVS